MSKRLKSTQRRTKTLYKDHEKESYLIPSSFCHHKFCLNFEERRYSEQLYKHINVFDDTDITDFAIDIDISVYRNVPDIHMSYQCKAKISNKEATVISKQRSYVGNCMLGFLRTFLFIGV